MPLSESVSFPLTAGRVEAALIGQLPRGARPDLSVDGTTEIERLSGVLHVGRPAYGPDESAERVLFKLDADGKSATRVRVKFGGNSVNSIQILQGSRPGTA